MTISEVLKKIHEFNNKPGVGFNPRCIVVSSEAFEELGQEINDLTDRNTIYNSTTNHMEIAGIKIVSASQVLRLK